jgi:PST family polysaccharide transporter
MLGTVALGAYTFGWSIANIPVEKVSAVLSRVTSGIFASAQHDDAAIRRYLLSITEGLALITFPVAAGLALVSREFVLLLLGDKWEPAILPMALLVGYSGFRSVTLLFSQILVATGRARRNMHFGVIALVVLPVLFVIGAQWGTAGVAFAWIVGYPAVFVPFAMRYTFQVIGLSWTAYGRSLWPAVSSTAVMIVAVLAARWMLPGGDDARAMALRLTVLVAVGVASYAAIGLGVHGERIRTFRTLISKVRG